jgi:ParB-like chromosome segregation protein Spo0J
MKLKISELNPNPFKKEINGGKLKEEIIKRIQANIKELGLMGSIPVFKKDGKYFLVAGHHRVEALKESGEEISEFGNAKEIMDKAEEIALGMLKAKVRPEFLNRIDKTIIFDYLNKENIRKIVELQFKGVQKKLVKNGIKLSASEEALSKMTDMSYEPEYGARPVKRMIHDEILNQLSKEILSSKVAQNSEIEIRVKDDQFVFVRIVAEENVVKSSFGLRPFRLKI